MGTNECSQLASKSSCDSQDFGDISMVLKMANFRKSTGPQWVNVSSLGKCQQIDLVGLPPEVFSDLMIQI